MARRKLPPKPPPARTESVRDRLPICCPQCGVWPPPVRQVVRACEQHPRQETP